MLNAVSSLVQAYQIPVEPAKAGKPSAKPESKPAQSALGEDKFIKYGSLASLAAGGGFAAYKLSGKMAANFKELAEAMKPGQGGNLQAAVPSLQKIAGTTLQGAGLSALVSAGVSAVSNGIGVARGKVDGQTAVKNVMADGISGAIGGFGAVSAGATGSMLLGAFGVVGLPLTIGTVAFGAAGGVLAGRFGQKLQTAQAATAA